MKRNRDKLLEMDEYDKLCRMNEALKRKKAQTPHDIRMCIMDVLDSSGYELCNGAANSSEKACGKCISAWLNEEASE